jgi:transcriptional regulator with XRE-family HTH domain
MSYQIGLDPYERAFAHFLAEVRDAIQRTYAEEAENGLTQRELAETLGVDESLISRRLSGPGNITLRTLCDLYTAMGREPLANFAAPMRPPVPVISTFRPEITTSYNGTANRSVTGNYFLQPPSIPAFSSAA